MASAAQLARRFGGLWGQPDFVRLWCGQGISQLGSQFSALALPLVAVLLLDASAFEMGLLQAARSVPALLVGLVAGVWVDRLRRRPILIGADLGRAALLGLVPLLAGLGLLRIEYLLAVVFAVGVLTIFFDVAYQAYLPSLVDRADLVEANGKLTATAQVALIVGPGLAGAVVQAVTAPFAVALDAVSFLLSALFLSRIRKPEKPVGTGVRRSVWQDAVEGVRFILAHPFLRLTLAAGMVNNLCVSALQAVLVLYMTADLGLPPAVIGLLFTAVGVGALAGTLAAAPLSRRLGPGPASVGAALVLILAFGCVPLAGLWPAAAVPLLLGHLFLQPLGLLLLVVTSGSIWQAVTPDHLLGRVNGTRRVAMWATPPVGALLGGAVGAAFGLWAITVAAAVGSLGVLLFVALGAARLDELPAASGR